MKLLMCPPAYYGIEYEINPWMSRKQQSNRHEAGRQWDQLFALLREKAAVEVELVKPQPGLPDMVFTANAGLVFQDKFIASNFRHDVRRGESPHYKKWFGERGFEVVGLPEQYFFEGEGDLLKCGELWFAGYHIRSDILAHQKVAEIIEREILSLELTDQWFYHLDTCFCPLGENRALFYPAAFDAYALKVLEDHIPELIPVTAEEASRFACNAIISGTTVIMNGGSPVTCAKLEALGFGVIETPVGEFLKAGGSAKCLALIMAD